MDKARKTLAWALATILVLLALIGWGLYERSSSKKAPEPLVQTSPEIIKVVSTAKEAVPSACPTCCCCEAKPKAKPRAKVKKAKPKQPPKQYVTKVEPVPVPAAAVASVIPVPPPVVAVERKPLLDGVDPDYGKTKVELTPLPEKEVPQKIRRIVVVQEQTYPQYPLYPQYYAPAPVYSQPAYVPAQQVIVQAPPVFTQAPAAVVGRPPAGVLNGRAPAGVVGRAW